jgi:hypothetical protein
MWQKSFALIARGRLIRVVRMHLRALQHIRRRGGVDYLKSAQGEPSLCGRLLCCVVLCGVLFYARKVTFMSWFIFISPLAHPVHRHVLGARGLDGGAARGWAAALTGVRMLRVAVWALH